MLNQRTRKRIEHFDSRASAVQLWRGRSQELYDAAVLVWEGGVVHTDLGNGVVDEYHTLHRPAQLLMGLCLETLLKGLIVQRKPGSVTGGRLPAALKTHSLPDLFSSASIPLDGDPETRAFLQVLTAAIEWISRYPVPLTSEQLAQRKRSGRDLLERNESDFARFEALRKKLLAELNDA